MSNLRTYSSILCFPFTGKELDSETGYSYFGARYLDHVLMTGWLSVDPMADKYPSLSPYAYCAWNPVRIVDPNGEFGVPTHRRIVKESLKGKKIGFFSRIGILFGAGRHSDWFHPFDSSIHFDNMNGFENIKELYREKLNNFYDSKRNGNYIDAGENLHAIADFYSHSNYVDLYKKYVEHNGGIIDAEKIEPFSVMMDNADFIKFVEKNGGLRTGTFSFKEWIKEKLFFVKPKKGSHTLMNLDSNIRRKSPQGVLYYDKNKKTYHDVARTAAQKEINNLTENAFVQ